MRILTIGGTQFIGRHFVRAALDGGHEVTIFHRGRTGAGLFPQATHLTGDGEQLAVEPLELGHGAGATGVPMAAGGTCSRCR